MTPITLKSARLGLVQYVIEILNVVLENSKAKAKCKSICLVCFHLVILQSIVVNTPAHSQARGHECEVSCHEHLPQATLGASIYNVVQCSSPVPMLLLTVM